MLNVEQRPQKTRTNRAFLADIGRPTLFLGKVPFFSFLCFLNNAVVLFSPFLLLGGGDQEYENHN